MIRFEGKQPVSQPPPITWNHLGNANFVVQCIPYVHQVTVPGTDEALIDVRPSFAFIQGHLDVQVKIAERLPNHLVKILLTSKGMIYSASVEIVVHIAEIAEGSELSWATEVKQVGGLLKLVPVGLIHAAAEKMIPLALNNLVQRLDALPRPGKA